MSIRGCVKFSTSAEVRLLGLGRLAEADGADAAMRGAVPSRSHIGQAALTGPSSPLVAGSAALTRLLNRFASYSGSFLRLRESARERVSGQR
jgi:hypothetical protein